MHIKKMTCTHCILSSLTWLLISTEILLMGNGHRLVARSVWVVRTSPENQGCSPKKVGDEVVGATLDTRPYETSI